MKLRVADAALAAELQVSRESCVTTDGSHAACDVQKDRRELAEVARGEDRARNIRQEDRVDLGDGLGPDARVLEAIHVRTDNILDIGPLIRGRLRLCTGGTLSCRAIDPTAPRVGAVGTEAVRVTATRWAPVRTNGRLSEHRLVAALWPPEGAVQALWCEAVGVVRTEEEIRRTLFTSCQVDVAVVIGMEATLFRSQLVLLDAVAMVLALGQ